MNNDIVDVAPQMAEYNMDVQNSWFDLIVSGLKPVEGRKMSPTWRDIQMGDRIILKCAERADYLCIVKGVTYYPSTLDDPLTSYLIGETLERTLPGINSIEEGRRIYLQWSKEDEIKMYGMMGIQF